MSEDYKILYTIGLPEPSYYQTPSELELSSSPWEQEELIHTINSLNKEQKYAFSEIIDSINSKHNRKLYIQCRN